MQKGKIIKSILTVATFSFLVSSCTIVKPFQKNKINDAEMGLSLRQIEKGDNYFQTIEEGASGADGGKIGGGCGCN